MTHLMKWRTFAPLGLTLVGFGVSVVSHTVERRVAGASFGDWFVWGTAGLILLNAGLALFGESIKHRVLFELGEERPEG